MPTADQSYSVSASRTLSGTVHDDVAPEETAVPLPVATTTPSETRVMVKATQPLCPSGSLNVAESVGVVVSASKPSPGNRFAGTEGGVSAGVIELELPTNES